MVKKYIYIEKWKRNVETTEQEKLRQRNLVYTQKIYENIHAKLSVVASSDMLVEENNELGILI